MSTEDQFKAIMEALKENREDTIVIKTEVGNLAERAVEDRTKRDTQVIGMHERLDAISGDYRETKGEIDAHVADANRHTGEAPGGVNGKTIAVGTGGVAVLMVAVEFLKQYFGGG